MFRLVLTAILLLLLTACGGVIPPNNRLVEKAIALGLEKTQQQLGQKLDLDFQGFEINRLSISTEEVLLFEKLPTYHIKGTYNLTFKLPKKQLTQPKKPFDVYLQIQKQGKTWRAILPDTTNKDSKPVWRSYLIE